MEIPLYISVLFVFTTALTVFFFHKATRFSLLPLFMVLSWLVFIGISSFFHFFTITDTLPPRFILLVAPPLFMIIFLFITTRGRLFLNKIDVKMLTLLHIVRVPVEVVLYMLSMHKAVPELMTFDGINYDILSGLTAPVIFYLAFVKQNLNKKIFILWNLICLLLLFNIVIHAVLSDPSPFQQLAFDQPNKAVLYFPFVWLPGGIVPFVLFAHLVTLYKLLQPVNAPLPATKAVAK
jgi:hypothetical protein